MRIPGPIDLDMPVLAVDCWSQRSNYRDEMTLHVGEYFIVGIKVNELVAKTFDISTIENKDGCYDVFIEYINGLNQWHNRQLTTKNAEKVIKSIRELYPEVLYV